MSAPIDHSALPRRTRPARLLLLGASSLALGTPLAAHDLIFATGNGRMAVGERVTQPNGLTQIALSGGGTVSIVDAADYRLNADGSIDLYEGSITVAAGPAGEVVVRLPEGLEGRIGGSGAAANFVARANGEARGHVLSGAARIGRAGALARLAASALWRAAPGGEVRQVIANPAQPQPDAPGAVVAIGGDAGPVAAAANGLPVGLASQLAAAGASGDILAAARRIEAAVGNPALETFPSGDLALLVSAAARLEQAYGGRPFPEAQADIIRAYLRFLAGGGAGSGFITSFSRFAIDYLELIRATGLPSRFAAAQPQEVEAYLAFIRRTGALASLAARDRVLAEAYLAFLANGGNRDGFARSFTDLAAAYFAFVRVGGDPDAFAGASEAVLRQTIAFLSETGLIVQLSAADRALVEAFLANGGLAFAAQYQAALDDYFAFLASGRRPSEYAARDQATLRSHLETLERTGLLTRVLGARAAFFADYLAFLRGGGGIDDFAGLPANIFAGYAAALDAYFAFLAEGRLPSEYSAADIALLQAYLHELDEAGALERFLGARAAFFRAFAAFVAAGGQFDAFPGLPAVIFAGYAAELEAFYAFLAAGGVPSAYRQLTPQQLADYLAALEAAGATLRFLGTLADFYRAYALYLAGGGDPDLFAGLPGRDGGGDSGGGGNGGGGDNGGGTIPAPLPGYVGGFDPASAKISIILGGERNGGIFVGSEVGFDAAPYVLDADGGLLSYTRQPGGQERSRGAARQADVFGNANALIGRWTDGTIAIPNTFTFSPNQGLHYVLTRPAAPNILNTLTGRVDYYLIAATRPTIGNGAFAPGRFEAGMAIALDGEYRLAMEGTITMPGGANPYVFSFATAGGLADPSRSQSIIGANTNSIFFASIPGTDNAGNCSGNPDLCAFNLRGAFAGDTGTIGISYEAAVIGPATSMIGTAIFQAGPTRSFGDGGGSGSGGSGGGGGGGPITAPPYSGTRGGLRVLTTRFGIGSTSIESYDNATVTFDANGNIATYTNRLGSTAGSGQPLADAQAEAGSIAGALAWARFLDAPNASGPVSSTGVHTIVGNPAINLPTAGTVTYTLIGATRPTTNQGTADPGSFSGALAVDFATRRVGIDLNVAIADRAWRLATAGGAANPANGGMQLSLTDSTSFFGSGSMVQVSGRNGASCTAGCTADVQGSLFGPGGSHAGIAYRVSDGALVARGLGIFAAPGAPGAPATTSAGSGAARLSAAPTVSYAGADWGRWGGLAAPAGSGALPGGGHPLLRGLDRGAPGQGAIADALTSGDRRAAIHAAERLLGGLVSFAEAGPGER